MNKSFLDNFDIELLEKIVRSIPEAAGIIDGRAQSGLGRDCRWSEDNTFLRLEVRKAAKSYAQNEVVK